MSAGTQLVNTAPRLSSALLAVLCRDVLLAYRHRGEIINPIVFFFMVGALIPLGVSQDPIFLAKIAPGIIWVMALLATLLSMDSLFRSDFDDGTLEQLVISPHPLYLLVLVKVLVHWLVTGLPLAIASPVLGLWLSLPESGYIPLFVSLLLGTLSLSLLGGIGAALTVALRKGGVLVSVLIIPMYTPVLLFGVAVVTNGVSGIDYGLHVAILGALLSFSLCFAPFAIAAGVKLSVSN